MHITGIVDDAGNTWAYESGFGFSGANNIPDVWRVGAASAITSLDITFHVSGIAFGMAFTINGQIIVAEYSSFAQAFTDVSFSGTQEVHSTANYSPAPVVGLVLFAANTPPINSFTGPDMGGTVRQQFYESRPPGTGVDQNYTGLCLMDDLTGGGVASQTLGAAPPPSNFSFTLGTIAGSGSPPPPTGNIIIQKSTSPGGSAQPFTFTSNYGAPFTLTDGQGNNSGSLAPGTYSVTETPVPGWQTTTSSDPSNIVVVAGATTVVIFTNTESHIIVQKVTSPGGSPQPFTFTPSWGSPFSLTDTQSHDSGPLAPGTYSIVETPIAGWTITTSQDPSAIVLSAGQTVIITFTNTSTATPTGTIIIRKATIPTGAAQQFVFTPSWGSPFTLGDGQQQSSGPLTPGTYSVSVAAVTVWVTTPSQDPSAIVLAGGQTITITFTNVQNIPPPPPPPPCVDSDACPFTLADAQAALGMRLYDPNHVFWTLDELTAYIVEALRTWNALASYWRDEFTFPTVEGTVWYDITDLTVAPNTLRPFTVTDQEILEVIEYHLLEPITASFPLTWTGSQQFTVADLQQALSRKRDEIVATTACTITKLTVPANPGRVALPNRVTEIRRVAFIPRSTTAATPLFEDDLWALQAYSPMFTTSVPGTPTSYARSTEPIRSTTLGPAITFRPNVNPGVPGEYEVLALESGVAFCPTGPSLVSIPDDWTWVLKWGALADLLSRESNAKDEPRAAYAMRRYRDGLALLTLAPALLTMRQANLPVQIDAVKSADQYRPTWEGGTEGTPARIVSAGMNLIGVAPPPPVGPVTLTADVIRNAPVPCRSGVLPGLGYGQGPFGGPPGWGGGDATTDDTLCCLQVTRDAYDVILDYAQHLSAFKQGGAEFEATMPLLERFMTAAALSSSRLGEQGEFQKALWERSRLEDEAYPRYRPNATPETLNG